MLKPQAAPLHTLRGRIISYPDMWIFVLLVLFVLGVALYDFYVSRIWQELQVGEANSAKVRARHRRASILRKTYNRIMLYTVGGLVFLLVLSFYTREIVSNMYPAAETEEMKYDTVQMSLEAPPLEEINTLPENVQIEGNAKTDQEAQTAQEASKGNKSQNDENDDQENTQPPKQTNGKPQPESYTTPDGLTLTPRDFPSREDYDKWKKSQEQLQESRDRNKSGKANRDAQAAQNKTKAGQTGNNKSNTAPPSNRSGEADVKWDKTHRKAYQNNDDNLPTPKYKCDSGGKVAILVKVSSDGYVVSATSQSPSAAGCLIEEAKSYARRARFESSSKPVDEFVLTYTFYK